MNHINFSPSLFRGKVLLGWRHMRDLPNVRGFHCYVQTKQGEVLHVTVGQSEATKLHYIVVPEPYDYRDFNGWAQCYMSTIAAAWEPLSKLSEQPHGAFVEVMHTDGLIRVHKVMHGEATQHGVTLRMRPELSPNSTHWRIAKCA